MDTRLNRTDYILLAVVYTISTVLNCIDYYKEGNELVEYFVDFSSTIITSFCVILLFMYWVIPNFLIKKTSYIKLAFFSLVILCFFGTIDYVLGFWSGGNDWSRLPKWHNLALQSIFNAANDSGLVFGILLAKKFYESQTQILHIEKEKKENELKLLRSQLDPHFLFNNLNTLDALIDSNPKKAKEYINRLSLIYRYLIQTKDAEIMELAQEMSLAENYIFLIKTRFGKDYDFQIIEQAPLSNKFVPTGAIQALLENVVKHNKVKDGNTIKALITVSEDSLTVSNTKSGLTSNEESLGTGLNNLKARYKLLSDKEIKLLETKTIFEITIPVIKLSVES